MEKTKRVKVVTGLKCNAQCIFCYYRDNLKLPNRPYHKIEADIAYAKKHGIKEIDFSGGEPTIHPELSKLIENAKLMGMEKVCIITNGIRLADKEYVRSLKDAGLDEILFSVHGSCDKVHDEMTMVPGSFRKITEGLSNAASEGIKIRINSVVNRLNYEDLTNIGSFVIPYKPIQFNFITINDWCFAKNLVDRLMLRYSEMGPKLKEACDFLEHKIPAVNVRYIPFCFMTGYERFVCNHKQVQYDPFEWVQRVRARLEEQNSVWRYLGILSYGYAFAGGFKNTFSMKFSDVLDESVVEGLRRWFYTKSPECRGCMLEGICDGVENSYAEKFGLGELTPVIGKTITDPVHFRRENIR